MHIAIYLPLLSAAILGLSARWLAHRLPPATATKVLSTGTVLVSGAASFSLGVLAFLLVARIPPAADLGRWSVSVLQHNPVPPAVSSVAAVGCLVFACSYVMAVWRQTCAALHARAHCARIGGEPGRLVVLDSGHADAYALTAGHGRIVVTRPLLQGLNAGERRALLAHERAHLANHHHRYRLAVALAAAICPLLRPVRSAVLYTTERWADETAADETANRRLVATTLARASLLVGTDTKASPSLALRAATSPIARRVRALLLPYPKQRPLLVAALLVLVALTIAASLDVRTDTEHLLEAAFNASTTQR